MITWVEPSRHYEHDAKFSSWPSCRRA